MWKIAISRPFWFFYRPLLSLSKNCLLVTCITNLKRILVKMLKLSRLQTRSNYWRKMRKIAINRPFWIFFQPLLNLSKNYLLVTCIKNLKRICEKLFKLSGPQGQIIDVKWEKSQWIGHFFFFSAIIELVQELLISNIHTKVEENMWKTFQVIAPTGSNYWFPQNEKNRNKSAIFFFFRPLLNLSKNYLLVTCINNLKRICEKLFNLSRPQGQIIDVKCEKSQ